MNVPHELRRRLTPAPENSPFEPSANDPSPLYCLLSGLQAHRSLAPERHPPGSPAPRKFIVFAGPGPPESMSMCPWAWPKTNLSPNPWGSSTIIPDALAFNPMGPRNGKYRTQKFGITPAETKPIKFAADSHKERSSPRPPQSAAGKIFQGQTPYFPVESKKSPRLTPQTAKTAPGCFPQAKGPPGSVKTDYSDPFTFRPTRRTFSLAPRNTNPFRKVSRPKTEKAPRSKAKGNLSPARPTVGLPP